MTGASFTAFLEERESIEKLEGWQMNSSSFFVDGRPSTAEAPPIDKIRSFSKMAVTCEPLMGF